MFNGNKIEENVDLKSMNEIQENKINDNYHYINENKNDDLTELKKDNSKIKEQNYNTNIEENSNFYHFRKISPNSKENSLSNRLSSRNTEIKNNFPNYLINIDLNKLSINNHKNIDISLLSSTSFLNNNRPNYNNNRENKEISPEKYLDDILQKNELDIQNDYNKIFIQTLSSENNDNHDNQNNSILTNSIKSSSEFDFLKNTLNKNRIENNLDKINRLSHKKNYNNIKENFKDLKIEKECKTNSGKIINHDDIPIVANTSSFMELLEKELANENLNNSKYNNKSFDIQPNTRLIKNKNKDKKINNEEDSEIKRLILMKIYHKQIL